MSKKFSELNAVVLPIDYGSIMAASTYDGVSAYTSEKYTLDNTQNIMLVNTNPNGRTINFQAPSATPIITADSSNLELYNTDASTYYWVNDGNGGDFSKVWFYGDSSVTSFGFGQNGGANGNSYYGDNDEIGAWQDNKHSFRLGGTGTLILSNSDLGSGGIASRNLSVNATTYKNSFAVGGVNITMDMDDAAFCSNLVIRNPTVPATAADTGVVGQISWDTDYMYVCTASNTWKRTAIATW